MREEAIRNTLNGTPLMKSKSVFTRRPPFGLIDSSAKRGALLADEKARFLSSIV